LHAVRPLALPLRRRYVRSEPAIATMPIPHKPDNYSAVSPYLIVEGAEATLKFLAEAFGAIELRRFSDDNGGIIHAEVRIDDSVIMIADGNESWPAVRANVHVYVPDVDATYQRALKAGGHSVQEPTKRDDEDKRGGLTDPGGTTWWIATRVE
jgi:PhnB protein